MPARLEIAIACDLARLDLIQAEIGAFARRHGLPGKITHALELVAEEVISNIIRHGFPPESIDARIRCVAEISANRVELAFIDNGAPFDPLTAAPAPDLCSSLEEREVGGLGVHLIKSIADAHNYARVDGENRLKVSWRRE